MSDIPEIFIYIFLFYANVLFYTAASLWMFSYSGKATPSPRKQKIVVVVWLLFGFLVLGLDLISALMLTLSLIYCHKRVAPLFENIQRDAAVLN